MSTLIDAIAFADRFGELGEQFSSRQNPAPLPAPHLIAVSHSTMALCGIDARAIDDPAFTELFSGNRLPATGQPRAAVYSGHQFGVWAGQLGDGRAILLGELNGYEVQLKGAGQTPYSRMADGRAVLRSSIREFLCSEAMHGLGIPTTRALCLTGSSLHVMREQPESTAVVTRVAPSFIRFGSFEHWYYRDDQQALQRLADFVIDRYFPALRDAANPYAALLTEVTRRTATLMAQWQTVGFMHGVMNTDNMSILGLTLDYGPFGFMEAFDPRHICNHSDDRGRYAYDMQPQIGEWNCRALGQALLPLVGSVDDTLAALADYQSVFQSAMAKQWQAKLGLRTTQPDDEQLVTDMLRMMAINGLDFTVFFRRLGALRASDDSMDHLIADLCMDRQGFLDWVAAYRQRLLHERSDDGTRRAAMDAANPKYVLRNYLAQVAIDAAQRGDFSEIDRLVHILATPFAEQPEHDAYANLPPDWGRHLSVSCSS